MTVQELASLIAKQEGKRHQASVGDVREILKITLGQLALMNTIDLGKLLSKYVKTTTKKFKRGK